MYPLADRVRSIGPTDRSIDERATVGTGLAIAGNDPERRLVGHPDTQLLNATFVDRHLPRIAPASPDVRYVGQGRPSVTPSQARPSRLEAA